MLRRTAVGTRLILFCILSTTWSPLLAVNCTEDSVRLYTQENVDNFQSLYGPVGGGVCDTAQNLVIENTRDISNLDGLSDLRDVGSLVIKNNDVLTNLDGLSGITQIRGYFNLADNPVLEDIDGLSNVSIVVLESEPNGGLFQIRNNPLLENLDGLSSLMETYGSFSITQNPALSNIDGLSNLTVVNALTIAENDALTDLDALSGLTSAAAIFINKLPALTDIDGLSGLTSIGTLILQYLPISDVDSLSNLTSAGSLYIGDTAVANLDGLSNLRKVDHTEVLWVPSGRRTGFTTDGGLRIVSNDSLGNLDGLSSLREVQKLYVARNWALSDCQVLQTLIDGIDDYEPGPGEAGVPDVAGEIIIRQNGEGCRTTGEIIDFEINAGHSGAWFNPDNPGQGLLIDVDPVNQFIFLAWFTFTSADAAAPDEQHWFTAQGNYTSNQADLTVNETLGGAFNQPGGTSTTEVGQVRLSFFDCEHGQVSFGIDPGWRLGAFSGNFPLERVIPGSSNVCEELAGSTDSELEAMAINSGMDGAWANLDTLGQGFFIDVYQDPVDDNFIFVAWFTYGEGSASGQRWLTAQGGIAGSTAAMEVYETKGGRFTNPKAVSTVKVGTMSIDLADCSNASLTFSLSDQGIDGDMIITRLIPEGATLCEELSKIR